MSHPMPTSTEPIDPSSLAREDPRLDQRWPVTLDGVSTEEVAEIVRLLDGAHIACHVETVSPRVRGMEWEGVTGLYDVLVREQDLRPAVAVLKPAFPERFPGEKLPDDSLWDFEAFGPAPVALCRLSWAQSWDPLGGARSRRHQGDRLARRRFGADAPGERIARHGARRGSARRCSRRSRTGPTSGRAPPSRPRSRIAGTSWSSCNPTSTARRSSRRRRSDRTSSWTAAPTTGSAVRAVRTPARPGATRRSPRSHKGDVRSRGRGATARATPTVGTTTFARRSCSASRDPSCSTPTRATSRSSPGIGSIFRRAHRTRRRWARRAAAAWRRGDREGRVPRRSALVLRARRDRNLRAGALSGTRARDRCGARRLLVPMARWADAAGVPREDRGVHAAPSPPDPGPVSGLVRGPQATSASCVRIDRSDPCDEPRGDRAGAARAGARRDGARPRVRAVPRAVPTKVAEALPARTLDRAATKPTWCSSPQRSPPRSSRGQGSSVTGSE